MKNSFLFLSLLCLVCYAECNYQGRERGHFSLSQLLKNTQQLRKQDAYSTEEVSNTPVYAAPQHGLKEADKIDKLPGQPTVNFNQYSGYVTVDPKAGRALFYYFAEAEDPSSKPLVLWLNGGPGCSSLGAGAFMELGPFRVNPDGKTLWYNKYAWNKVANVLFLESPAGVGFSYSNKSTDYVIGDIRTAADSYAFLINWLKRYPEYKTRDFFLAGESYAGHYVPQLAELILKNNKIKKHTIINLKGIAIGNAYIDYTDLITGIYDSWWTNALISDETHNGIEVNCDFSPSAKISPDCKKYAEEAETEIGNVYIYDIYAPLCRNNSSSSISSDPSISGYDPCSEDYVYSYLNTAAVQKALHVNKISGPWQHCSESLNWTDTPDTVLPVIKKLMGSGIGVWIYSGDTDGRIPVTSTRYSMAKLGKHVNTKWYPWDYEGEVGGYVVGYENVTFATIRGSGHFVPSYKPGPALALFSSFLKGRLPPKQIIQE